MANAEHFSLPTPGTDLADARSYLQPTAPGLANGGFGMVRENGTRFHAGIDIRPHAWSPEGEAADPVFATAAGRVAYVNRAANASNYGIHVIVEHGDLSLPVLSLYAHLAEARQDLIPGMVLAAGEVLGRMGHTGSGYEIPRTQSHLHFGLGVHLGDADSFDRWYARQGFSEANGHGHWNTLNVAFFDPLPILRGAISVPLAKYLQDQPTAFTTRIAAGQIPQLLRRCPALWLNRPDRDGGAPAGFTVEWTWYGLPKSWTGSTENVPESGAVEVQLLRWQKDLLDLALRRKTLERDGDGTVWPGECTRQTLEKIFGLPVKSVAPAGNSPTGMADDEG
ncbi:MAG: M23 family metallopeptidase [Puniceicoccales bacterium]|nr:M23 family metallopeptidase [Puniceicoccales bacterium]